MRAREFIRRIHESADDASSTVVAEVIKLIGEGHTEVSPDVITTKVSAALGRPFMLKDLVAANNSSPELQHYIDTINPSKIKFSTDILTVKNQDPVKEKERAEAGVASMAARAASRPKLGESDQGASKSAETKFHKKLDKLVHSTFGKRKGEVEEGWGAEPAAARHQEQMTAVARVLQKYKNDPVKSKIANYLFVNNWSAPAIEKELANPNAQQKFQANMDKYEQQVGPVKDWTDSMANEYLNDQNLDEGKDACYHKVKSRYKVWPSAYASGALSKCRKVGAKNWGNKSKK